MAYGRSACGSSSCPTTLSSQPRRATRSASVLTRPAQSVVPSLDEQSQIQALDHSQPDLPLKKGRCGAITHDDKRNGTTTLFAALAPRYRPNQCLICSAQTSGEARLVSISRS